MVHFPQKLLTKLFVFRFRLQIPLGKHKKLINVEAHTILFSKQGIVCFIYPRKKERKGK